MKIFYLDPKILLARIVTFRLLLSSYFGEMTGSFCVKPLCLP